jgi:hypothetical protein
MLNFLMLNFSLILTALQAAIAVVAARERALTALLVAVWGRIGRINARLERMITLWRAGILPKARAPRGKVPGMAARKIVRIFPSAPAWLLVAVREAAPLGVMLQNALSEAECAEFLAAYPQARRLLRPLSRMLGVGVVVRKTRKVWVAPKSETVTVRAGLVLGPNGKFFYA